MVLVILDARLTLVGHSFHGMIDKVLTLGNYIA